MPVNKQAVEDLIGSLEGVLVNAFRLCESLYTLTKDERQALLDANTEVLDELAKKKEQIVTQMEHNEEVRHMVMEQTAQAVGVMGGVKNLSELLEKLENVNTEQIVRLQQGILALQAEIRELNNGNYALATLNIQRMESVQNYIVGLMSTPNYYRPTISSTRVEPPASWGMDHRA